MRNKRGIVTMIKAIEDTKTGQQTEHSYHGAHLPKVFCQLTRTERVLSDNVLHHNEAQLDQLANNGVLVLHDRVSIDRCGRTQEGHQRKVDEQLNDLNWHTES